MVSEENVDKVATEEFDMQRIFEIAEMSKEYAKDEYSSSCIPDNNYSDFECILWQLMNHLIRYGRELERGEL